MKDMDQIEQMQSINPKIDIGNIENGINIKIGKIKALCWVSEINEPDI